MKRRRGFAIIKYRNYAQWLDRMWYCRDRVPAVGWVDSGGQWREIDI